MSRRSVVLCCCKLVLDRIIVSLQMVEPALSIPGLALFLQCAEAAFLLWFDLFGSILWLWLITPEIVFKLYTQPFEVAVLFSLNLSKRPLLWQFVDFRYVTLRRIGFWTCAYENKTALKQTFIFRIASHRFQQPFQSKISWIADSFQGSCLATVKSDQWGHLVSMQQCCKCKWN